MVKADREIIRGFESGGARNVCFVGDGRHRSMEMEIDVLGKCVVHKLPTSSHLDGSALNRKARDYCKKFIKYQTTTLAW